MHMDCVFAGNVMLCTPKLLAIPQLLRWNGWCRLDVMQKAVSFASSGCTILGAHAKPKEREQLTSGDISLLTGPHQISFSEPGSLTTRLSDGERPVFAPEYAVKAPVEVIADPVS